jgi:hypothetical protein
MRIDRLEVVANTCNSVTWRLRQKDHEFKASLGYIETV